MIILLGSQKGGCGKSTLAINIATFLALQKKDVVIVDADIQSTSARWIADRQENGLPIINCVQKYGDIKNTLNDLNNRYAFVIVDVAGKDSKELRTGMLATDILLIPFRPSQMDLDTIIHLNEVIETAKDFNNKLKVYAVLNLSSTNPMVSEAKEAEEYLKEFPNLVLLKTIIHDRKIFRDVIPKGQGVIESGHQRSKEEIKNLIKELLKNGN